MDIVEATKKSDSTHAIRRKSWPNESLMLIPTDTTFLTSVMINGEVISVRWEPSRKDLIANDWELCVNPSAYTNPKDTKINYLKDYTFSHSSSKYDDNHHK